MPEEAGGMPAAAGEGHGPRTLVGRAAPWRPELQAVRNFQAAKGRETQTFA